MIKEIVMNLLHIFYILYLKKLLYYISKKIININNLLLISKTSLL